MFLWFLSLERQLLPLKNGISFLKEGDGEMCPSSQSNFQSFASIPRFSVKPIDGVRRKKRFDKNTESKIKIFCKCFGNKWKNETAVFSFRVRKCLFCLPKLRSISYKCKHLLNVFFYVYCLGYRECFHIWYYRHGFIVIG